MAVWCLFSALGCGGDASIKRLEVPHPEASVDIRNQEASRVLALRPAVVLLYARGLCCPSCAIGVRTTVSRLDFVDRSKPNRGVELDPKHQLVEIALRQGKSIEQGKLWQAIVDAGYDPITIFRNGPNGMETEDYTGSLP